MAPDGPREECPQWVVGLHPAVSSWTSLDLGGPRAQPGRWLANAWPVFTTFDVKHQIKGVGYSATQRHYDRPVVKGLLFYRQDCFSIEMGGNFG